MSSSVHAILKRRSTVASKRARPEEVKQLQDEYARFKMLVADLSMDKGHVAVVEPRKLTELMERKVEVRYLRAECVSN